ncbi:histidinol phosphatase [Desulfobacter hydrogenophilus]|uniref:Histidinol-phosphatase n=1 Tax=Desulfobacter hydrogenophilus TaxID=2291 RepID=A0A328FEL5_9BACT|nr:histidinol-phosphatase [Desulfobacter hydrogenophilus]NDY70801.1 histidinol-phosphatase [Desulfobacter hydrogenophilus]QBH11573.1 histidinol-phosphatase HisJ family protein [Desulfobacter hydrogenophilus]RAM03121.1 histidinol phosphatase [Desulfobacter hydrogenophilus]
MIDSKLISLHGGHSGQFCCHAQDSLEDLIKAYISKGFKAVGISEHMPPPGDRFLYPDELKQGLSVKDLDNRFSRYFLELERLRQKYKSDIRIFKGFETETVTGSPARVRSLIREFNPDYIVGSIHHLKDRCFDYSRQDYEAIAADFNGLDAMYMAYFDTQYEMILDLHPFVVGHFDLIRIYDPDFEARLDKPEISKRIRRNLSVIKDLGLVLDYNLRPLAKGKKRPYLTPVILARAKNLGIPVVPGDDAHSKEQAGMFVDRAIQSLKDMGFPTNWPRPWCMTPA